MQALRTAADGDQGEAMGQGPFYETRFDSVPLWRIAPDLDQVIAACEEDPLKRKSVEEDVCGGKVIGDEEGH